MKFGSVCSGIEAASVAWNPLGWEAAWFAEIEPFPSAVLAHHYPDVQNVGDMTKIVEMLHTFQIDAPDMLCGGTPCQAFSVAGLRNSLDDARGNLSLTFCEIANAIDTTRLLWGEQPAIIFWENVPGVLSTKDNAFGCFLAGLAGEDDALVAPGGKWTDAGYVHGPQRTVAWRTLDAQYFGLAQRRRRVFVVASAREGFDPAKVLFEFDGLRRDTAPRREARQEAAGTIAEGAAVSGTDCFNGAITGDVAATLGTRGSSQNASGPTAMVPTIAQCLTTRTGQRYDPETETETETILPFDTTQITSVANRSSPKEGDPCHPLAAQAHVTAIAFNIYSGNKRADRPEGGFYVKQEETTKTLDAATGLNPTCAQGGTAIAFSRNDDGRDATLELSPTLRVAGHADGMMAVALPINTMIALRHEALGERTGFGIGSETDPAFTVTKGHSHAVAYAVRTANTSANGHGVAEEVTHTLDRAQGQAVAFQVGPTSGEFTDVAPTMDCRAKNGPIQNQLGVGVLQPTAIGLDEEQNAMVDAFGTLKARTDGGGFEGAVMTPTMQVRRLTPVECARLQGFPDTYLDITYRNKPAADGPKYKALGNSWAVPVVRWIGQRIKEQL